MAPHHKRPVRLSPARLGTRGVRTALAGALGSAVAAVAAMPASAAPNPTPHGGTDVASVKADIAALYRQAEVLTQTYDAAQEQAGQLTIAVRHSQGALAEGRLEYVQEQSQLGRLASAQYRAGGIDKQLELMLSDHPDTYLVNAAIVDRLSEDQLEKVATAIEDERRLIQLQRTAADDLTALAATRVEAARDQQGVMEQLRRAQALLNTLTSGQRRAVARAEEGYEGGGGGDGVGGVGGAGGVGDGPGGYPLPPPAIFANAGPPSTRARAAIQAAFADIGKPYVYGAEGPDAFDCSGLIQRVWRQAGVELPRTSSEQATAGQQVPLSSIRPGDLVIYYRGRNHVGLYIGDGKIIHAPHPGSDVRVAPLMSMPVNMVVRVQGERPGPGWRTGALAASVSSSPRPRPR